MQSSTERFTLNPQARRQCVQLNGDKFRIRLTGKGKKKKQIQNIFCWEDKITGKLRKYVGRD